MFLLCAACLQRGALSRMQISWSALKTGRELGGGGFGTVYKGQWQVGICLAGTMLGGSKAL